MNSNTEHQKYLAELKLMAEQAIASWGFTKESSVSLLNLSENATYLVKAPNGEKSILRLHRPNYHSKLSIASELQWLEALRKQTNIETPVATRGVSGELIYLVHSNVIEPRHAVMFEFLPGKEPDADRELSKSFIQLGEITALMHQHSKTWKIPQGFERLEWNLETIFGRNAHWGDWRDAPLVSKQHSEIIERAVEIIKFRISQFNQHGDKYGLIHADLRLANLLVHEGKASVIDFDDCGFGFYLYDFATAISFIETDPLVPEWLEAWKAGYRKKAELSTSDEQEIPTFIMLRRLALLAWVGSHSETDLALSMLPHFAADTAKLAKEYIISYA
ncbi:MAG: phosphotransferase [Methylacidiphilales bacterium]|nr:phosphotransferase [Candidatus Methylacidiphilales bacterium]